MILVDRSVPIDLIDDHPLWRVWSEDALVRASSASDLAINVLINAETIDDQTGAGLDRPSGIGCRSRGIGFLCPASS